MAHQLRRLLERPPRRLPVTEIDPATGKETRVPYSRSREFLATALRRACEPVSLASFERGRTWLGDTTWRPDSLPFFPEHDKPVDEDLQHICLGCVSKYAEAFMSAAAHRGDPMWVCREALGCGLGLATNKASVTGVTGAFLETARVFDTLVRKNPSALLKLAPVFLVAFATPFLFRPTFAPPRAPGDQNEALASVRERRARRARVAGAPDKEKKR